MYDNVPVSKNGVSQSMGTGYAPNQYPDLPYHLPLLSPSTLRVIPSPHSIVVWPLTLLCDHPYRPTHSFPPTAYTTSVHVVLTLSPDTPVSCLGPSAATLTAAASSPQTR